MSKGNSTYLYFFKIVTIPVAIVCGIWLLAYYIHSRTDLMQHQQKQVSEVVHNAIQDLADKDMLLPEIVFIQGNDTTGQNLIADTLKTQIATILSSKYLQEDTATFQDLDFHPYFVLPNKSDSLGNYLLTQNQLNDLKSHIDFLTKQVDVEADKVKQEIGRDIDRLNTWVSIWIGILGFFGIFIPIFINYELRKDTNEAKRKSEEATDSLKKAKPQLDKVDGLETKVENIEKALPDITEKSSKAREEAETAASKADTASKAVAKTETLLNVFHSIARLKDLEAGTLKIVKDKRALLVEILKNIHTDFQGSNNHTDHEIIKDAIRQIGIQLHYISLYKFSDFDYTDDLNEFASFILDSLKKEMTKDNFDNITAKLKELIDKLKSD